MMVDTNFNNLTARANEALRRLASTRGFREKVLIDLPLIYPDGSKLVVELECTGGEYWISDMGNGALGAELNGASEFYKKAAKKISDMYSVSFDGAAIFALRVADSQLEAAIASIGTSSILAVHDALSRAAEAQNIRHNDRVFDQVKCIFGAKNVTKQKEVLGRHANWNAHNVVALDQGKMAIFEYMSNHPNSVSSKFMMYSDIRAQDSRIALNAVVDNLNEMDPKSSIIGNVANIIPINEDGEVYKKYAYAA